MHDMLFFWTENAIIVSNFLQELGRCRSENVRISLTLKHQTDKKVSCHGDIHRPKGESFKQFCSRQDSLKGHLLESIYEKLH